MTISIRKLTPVFGAEITDVDLTRLDDATFAEIEDAFEKSRNHPERYPLEGYADYRKFGPTPKHHFKVIFVVRDNIIWIVAIAHPARRVRYWARRKLRR